MAKSNYAVSPKKAWSGLACARVAGAFVQVDQVVHRGPDLGGGDGADGAGAVVRGDRDVGRVGVVGDFLGFEEAAHLRDVRSLPMLKGFSPMMNGLARWTSSATP